MQTEELLSLIEKHALFFTPWIAKDKPRALAILENFDARNIPVVEEELRKHGIQNVSAFTEKDILIFLRNYKHSEYLKICARELTGGSLEHITSHITTVAKVALEAALRWALQNTANIYRLPYVPDRMAVIGLGKLGGGDLNFSSDVDILYVYIGEGGERLTPFKTLHEFYCETARKATELMSLPTEDGMVFRVDTRLRPDGERGAIALSVDGYAFYYESYGETWERMMLLKASFAAGNKNTAKEFLKAVHPFAYRRSIDQAFVEEVTGILQKAQARARIRNKGIKNVKLGEGGIREIEFFIQILQILNYPRYKLASNNTLQMLSLLREHEIINPEDAEVLEKAYRFLRNLEHKAQMENESQTYVVPEGTPSYPLYLERCGYTGDAAFQRDYYTYTSQVESIFESLAGKGADGLTLGDLLFDNVFDLQEAVMLLKKAGIAEPERSAKLLYHTLYSPANRTRSAQEISLLKILYSAIIEKITSTDDSVQILGSYQRLFVRQTTVSMVYDSYAKSHSVIESLNKIFAGSRYLTDIVLSSNKVLDHLFSGAAPDYSKDEFYEMFIETIAQFEADLEMEYAKMRILHKEMLFRVGYAFLNRNIDVFKVMVILTNLARAVTDIAFERSFLTLAQRYGQPHTGTGEKGGYTVVAMGKLGSSEMSFASDLDLIVLYLDGETGTISNGEFYHRLVQRVTAYLSSVTENGYLYRIDMNLRPSGASGALVSTMQSYGHYGVDSAMVWEKQALLKAETICGEPELMEKFEAIRKNILNVAAGIESLKSEIMAMRLRLDRERGRNTLDLKFAPGGFTDIEFAVQMLSIKNALIERNTYKALELLYNEGFINKRDYGVLERGYIFYRKLENTARVYENRPTTKLPEDKARLVKISAALGYATQEQLINEYHAVRRAVRGAFDRIFSA